MAKITMMPGIASISGRVGNYSFRTMRATGKVYVRSMARKDPRPAKARFTAVEAMVRARKNDLSHMSEDQVNFLEQKNRADGCKTMRKYLWKICGQEYDAQHA